MSKYEKKILIGFSSYRQVESKAVESLVVLSNHMMAHHPEIGISFAWRDGFPVAGCKHCYDELPNKEKFEDARNHFAIQALSIGASHLFMIDSDMGIVDPDMIYQLLQHDVDIVAPLFIRRSVPYDLLAVRYLKESNAWKSISSEEAKSGKLIEVDAVGFGAVLINMTVLQRMKFPWFVFEFFKDKILPEDLNFCRKARRDGFRVFVDTSQHLNHIGSHVYRPSEGILLQEERE